MANKQDGRIAKLQADVASRQGVFARFHHENSKMDAATKHIETQLGEVSASAENVKDNFSAVGDELGAARVANDRVIERTAQVEEELAEERKRLKALQAMCSELAADRDVALERWQRTQAEFEQLKQRLGESSQDHTQREATLRADGEAHALQLRSAEESAQDRIAQNTQLQGELSALCCTLEEELAAAQASGSSLQERIPQLQELLNVAAGKDESARSHMEQLESELADEKIRLENVLQGCRELSSCRTAASEHSHEVEEVASQKREEKQQVVVKLNAEQDARQAAAARHIDLQQQYEKNMFAIKDGRQRADELADEVEEGRRLHVDETNNFIELRRRSDDLEFERNRQKKRADVLMGELEAERRLRAEATARHSELCGAKDGFEQEHAQNSEQVSQLVEQLTTEQQLSASSGERCSALQTECQRLIAEQGACTDVRGRASAELQRAAEAGSTEAQRADELQVMLDAVRPAQQELQRKHAAALEQLAGMEDEKARVSSERNELRGSLEMEREAVEQARRSREDAQRAIEEAGPTQLSVGDVLISVAFTGVPQPLELMPWDTNLEALVTKWLAAVQRSSRLQPSVVRYLTHLEATAEAFPVRVEASLLDIHEEFAL